AVLQRVRRLLDARKAGHTGTLDPLATGMLPICFGSATKTASLAISANKLYEATALLGIATDTGDALGKVVAEASVPALDETMLGSVIEQFTGEISQVPPRYSAVRYEGKRLYELARRGIEVAPAARHVRIHALEFFAVAPPELRIRVRCSKGTYIRTLVEDIGKALGTVAHVTALRRIGVDPFVDRPMVALDEIEAIDTPTERAARFLLPVDCVLGHLPRIDLDTAQAGRIRQGQRLHVAGSLVEGPCRIYEAHSQFVGIGHLAPGGELFPKRIFL
ncbi:MAG: tRNA pseudouridine(55) synthase TruB, partial [Gammaproteobacteria bacterium]